jgi:alanyl-tRNA synthetase
VDSAELRDIEQQVNEQIRANNELSTDVMAIEDALASGALAFFGDRYPEANVRVVTIADPDSPRGFYSKELCGGTHVKRSGDLGIFKILNESSVAAGVRRIEAISGSAALEEFQSTAALLSSLAAALNADPASLDAAARKLIESRRQLEKQLDALKNKAAQSYATELLAGARDVKGVKVVAGTVPDASRETLRSLVDSLRLKLGSGVVVLGTTEDGKVSLISGVTKDLTAKVHAGKLIQTLAKQIGGTGGGRPDLAEAGGKDTLALNSTLGQVYDLVAQLL